VLNFRLDPVASNGRLIKQKGVSNLKLMYFTFHKILFRKYSYNNKSVYFLYNSTVQKRSSVCLFAFSYIFEDQTENCLKERDCSMFGMLAEARMCILV
jgi:hypothetical protein